MGTNSLDTLLKVSLKRMGAVHPILQVRVPLLITLLYERGMPFAVYQGERSFVEQKAFYAQGRQPLSVVNDLRQKAGLYLITEKVNRRRITKVRYGLHNYGLAVDLVEDGDVSKVGVQWSWANTADYMKIGPVVKALNLGWGGFWKSWKDYPHAQCTGGLKLSEVRRIHLEKGRDGVWAVVSKRYEKFGVVRV